MENSSKSSLTNSPASCTVVLAARRRRAKNHTTSLPPCQARIFPNSQNLHKSRKSFPQVFHMLSTIFPQLRHFSAEVFHFSPIYRVFHKFSVHFPQSAQVNCGKTFISSRKIHEKCGKYLLTNGKTQKSSDFVHNSANCHAFYMVFHNFVHNFRGKTLELSTSCQQVVHMLSTSVENVFRFSTFYPQVFTALIFKKYFRIVARSRRTCRCFVVQ